MKSQILESISQLFLDIIHEDFAHVS